MKAWTCFLLLITVDAAAADRQPRTVAAFERYARLTESRLDSSAPFFWIDSLPQPQRQTTLDQVRRGGLVIERLTTRDVGREINVPDGLIHHWIGVTFVPGARIDEAIRLLTDYDAHAQIYQPRIARSKVIARSGDGYRFSLRFVMQKVITVVVNSEYEGRFARRAADRADGRFRSTRIAEVEDPGTPNERELPVGRDGGYLWRLNTYWRLLERDGGTYLQCESISLSRAIPTGLGWLVGPFVTSVPRESLAFTLETTANRLRSRRQ